MPPRFSISIPIGAYHPLLNDCLVSLSIQSPRPHVSLLDASGDPRVMALADRFDDMLSYRRHGPDAGQSDAIIEGWRETPGDILGWLNADDALYPGALAAAASTFEAAPACDVVYGHSVIINDDLALTGYHWAVEPPSDRILAAGIISQPSCFFRRSAYDAVGGLNADLHYTMDWDLWVRLWRAGCEFAFNPDILSRVLWTKDAKTGGFGPQRRRELSRIIDQNASLSRRVKSRIGFALHHGFEYLTPPATARHLRRHFAPSPATINGLGRNGEIEPGASLPLIHYGAQPVDRIELTLASGAVTASAASFLNETPLSAGDHALPLAAPWPACKIMLLRLKPAGSSEALFSHVRPGVRDPYLNGD